MILVTPVCTNENINAPWVTSLGFTYKKQGQPVQTWMNETLREHKIPLGGEIVFYCADASRRKRPKKDNFDDDPDDGLLYGYCTYAGTVSIPMTPAGRLIGYIQSIKHNSNMIKILSK